MNTLALITNIATALPMVIEAADHVKQEVDGNHPIAQKAEFAAASLTELLAEISRQFLNEKAQASQTSPGLEK